MRLPGCPQAQARDSPARAEPWFLAFPNHQQLRGCHNQTFPQSATNTDIGIDTTYPPDYIGANLAAFRGERVKPPAATDIMDPP